jgi:hypothetical protein
MNVQHNNIAIAATGFIMVSVYFLPIIIGGIRNKAHGGLAILLLNVFFGWTIVGWFVALIWASSGKTKGELRREEERHRELLRTLAGKQ